MKRLQCYGKTLNYFCRTLLNTKCSSSPLKVKAYLATRSFLLPLTLAPLHDNHRFKTETVQCSAGFGNLAPGISFSLRSTSSSFLSTNRADMAAISNQRTSPKTVPAFIWSLNRFKDYFEFRYGQFNDCILKIPLETGSSRKLKNGR